MFQQEQINALQAVAMTATKLDYGQAVLRSHVDQARAAGASWASIGAMLGITGAGARQRYSPPPPVKTQRERLF